MKNNKQEAIRKAYEEVGIPFNENILYDNGWTKIKPSQFASKYELVDLLKLTKHTHSIRPKFLAGIENNNGWIAIESEADLPKDSYNYWIRQSDGIITSIRQYDDNKKYWNVTATHYQPIIKPLPPIY